MLFKLLRNLAGRLYARVATMHEGGDLIPVRLQLPASLFESCTRFFEFFQLLRMFGLCIDERLRRFPARLLFLFHRSFPMK